MTSGAGARKWSWRLFFLLWIASIAGIMLVIPYALALLPPSVLSKVPSLYVVIPLQVTQGAVFLGLLTLAGLFLANRTGLGAPILEAWLDGRDVRSQLASRLLPGAVVGLVGGLAIIGLELLVFQPAIRNQSPAAANTLSLWNQPAVWKGLLASFFGAIDEEIQLRLFAMSLFAWLGRFLSRSANDTPGSAVLWSANIIAALLFGLGHLPLISTLVPLGPMIVLRTLVLNSLLGVAFGYLYWKRGLESAMVSHFCADVVLRSLPAFWRPDTGALG